MTSQNADDFRLTVLNPGGRDPEQRFHDGFAPGEGEHPPINFHAYAACTRGVFHYDTRRAIAEETPVLLLLRGEFRASERALAELKKHQRKVVVSLKETGLHQIAQQLCDRGKIIAFHEDSGASRWVHRQHTGSRRNLSARPLGTQSRHSRIYSHALSGRRSAMEFFCAA